MIDPSDDTLEKMRAMGWSVTTIRHTFLVDSPFNQTKEYEFFRETNDPRDIPPRPGPAPELPPSDPIVGKDDGTVWVARCGLALCAFSFLLFILHVAHVL